MSDAIKVLIVDDSAFARSVIAKKLDTDSSISIAGFARDGAEALEKIRALKPDVVTMDVQLPKMGGLEATRQIMREAPTPIVFVTAHTSRSDMDLTFEALQAGALTVVNKPGLADPVTCDKLIRTVRSMSEVHVVRRWGKRKPAKRAGALPAPAQPLEPPLFDDHAGQQVRMVGIASSTGGPGALAKVLGPLPADFSVPVLVVQHITIGFAAGFAEWLGTETALRVRLASHGDTPQPGTVLLAPDDYHILVNFRGQVELYKGMPYRGLRPSANYLFESLANVYEQRAMGIVLTGMGDDGAEGIEAIYKVGGLTVAQDEASCVVYGMPKEAVARGAVKRVLTLEQIALALEQLVRAGVRSR